jgi:hypothetical protein
MYLAVPNWRPPNVGAAGVGQSSTGSLDLWALPISGITRLSASEARPQEELKNAKETALGHAPVAGSATGAAPAGEDADLFALPAQTPSTPPSTRR